MKYIIKTKVIARKRTKNSDITLGESARLRVNSLCDSRSQQMCKFEKLNNSNVKKTKRQATDWEKIFANDISDKELLNKIYKELLKSTMRKQTT
jgi:hypothetical protein